MEELLRRIETLEQECRALREQLDQVPDKIRAKSFAVVDQSGDCLWTVGPDSYGHVSEILLGQNKQAVWSVGEDSDGHGLARLSNNKGTSVVEIGVGLDGHGTLTIHDSEGVPRFVAQIGSDINLLHMLNGDGAPIVLVSVSKSVGSITIQDANGTTLFRAP